MKNFLPTINTTAPTTPIPNSVRTNNQELIGMSPAQVADACQQKITAGTGTNRAATGDTFLNMVTPRLFIANLEKTELHQVPNIYANFDNKEDSLAVSLAGSLSSILLTKHEMHELAYRFKLIDSTTLVTIATDMPEYEAREDVESDLPSFMQAAKAAPKARTPKPNVCAFLHIYAEHEGKPVRIASNDIPVAHANQIALVKQLAAAGHHIQAGVVPQTKVANWISSLGDITATADIENAMLSAFETATEQA